MGLVSVDSTHKCIDIFERFDYTQKTFFSKKAPDMIIGPDTKHVARFVSQTHTGAPGPFLAAHTGAPRSFSCRTHRVNQGQRGLSSRSSSHTKGTQTDETSGIYAERNA